MNVLVLGGRIVGAELAHELIGAFLNARFSGEARHQRRLAKMIALENRCARSRSSASRCGSTTSAAA
jgi:ribose 5-phosphate isomerase RpiB